MTTEEMVALYESGMSIRQIAKESHRSYAGVHYRLKESGVTFRPRGGANRPRNKTNGQWHPVVPV